MPLRKKGLRQRIRQGQVVIGTLVQIASESVVEVLGLAGFDFVLIDQEHGPLTLKDVQRLVLACAATDTAPFVRVRGAAPQELTALLDTGVAGVHVPHVCSAEAVHHLVQGSRFHPEGTRGLNPFVRAADYSVLPVSEFVAGSNEDITLIVSVEGNIGLEQLDHILAVKGIDVVFLGPYDISHALGVPGEIFHPQVVDAITTAAQKITTAGLMAGVFSGTVEAAEFWLARGIRYIVFSVDTRLLLDAAQEQVRKLRVAVEAAASAIPAGAR